MDNNSGDRADKFLTRDGTKIMKAIAIILVFMNHLWLFPDRLAGGQLKSLFTIFGMSSIEYFSHFARISLSIFFFIGGYGTYIGCRGKQYDVVDRIKKLYFKFWKVFVVFIPIGFLFFSRQRNYCESAQVCSKFANFYLQEFIGNFLGIISTYNEEWWFLFAFVVAIASFPILRAIVERFSLIVNIYILLIGSLLMLYVFPAIGAIEELGNLNRSFLFTRFFCQIPTPYWMGIIVAKFGLLDRIKAALVKGKMLNPFMDVCIILMIFYLRQIEFLGDFDVFYVPVFIVVCVDLIDRIAIVKKLFVAIGSQTTNMWLIHSFFCYYFYYAARIVTFTGWAVPSLITLIIMAYIASICLDYFWSLVDKAVKIVGSKFVKNAE